jgi:hypothetical protein
MLLGERRELNREFAPAPAPAPGCRRLTVEVIT